MIRGSCLCGRIRFEFEEAVTQIGLCHCSLCRKVSGAAGDAVLMTPSGGLKWLAGEAGLRVFTRASGWRTTFCETCGSPMPQLHPSGGAYFVPAGVLDDDPGVSIGCHIFVGSKAPWDVISGDAPQWQEGLPAPGAAPAGPK